MALFRVVGRIALEILSRVSRSAALIGGFMAATAFLSTWVSNSAVALMMLPIGLSEVIPSELRALGRMSRAPAPGSTGSWPC